MNAEFRLSEKVRPSRKRRIMCQGCGKRPSDPHNDGRATWADSGKPVYFCADCQDSEDTAMAQEQSE